MGLNRTGSQNGYGEKLSVKIITVDKEKRRVECATRDGAMIWAAVWETGTVFQWPEVGQTWTVRKDTNVWRLDQQVQTVLNEEESEGVPKTLAELPEGDTRINGETVHMANASTENLDSKTAQITNASVEALEAKTINGAINYGLVTALPTGTIPKGSTCVLTSSYTTYVAGTAYPGQSFTWELIYTGEPSTNGGPWRKIGGNRLVVWQEGVSNYSAAPGTWQESWPGMIVPFKGLYEVTTQALTSNPTGGAAQYWAAGLSGAGAPFIGTPITVPGANYSAAIPSMTAYFVVSPASFLLGYMWSNVAGAAYSHMNIYADPLFVG